MKLRSCNTPENWLPVTIEPFNEFYLVSDWGRVKSLPRNNMKREVVLKAQRAKRGGYLVVKLSSGTIKKLVRINRLVALAHVPNPENLPEVNHQNGNKEDNTKDNLEWCSRSENVKHSYRLGLNKGNKQHLSKSVSVLGLTGNLITTFPSVREAARKLNLHCQNICAVLKGKARQTKGYKFIYSDEALIKHCKNELSKSVQ